MQHGGEATAANWDDVPRRLDERGSAGVSESVDFEAFVASRSDQLLRTAYLLTGDHGLAEDLLQTALAKAWRAWQRIDGHPEPYVRKILVNTYASLWRRRWNGEQPTADLPESVVARDEPAGRMDLWAAVGQLPKRQRAVVVLRFFEDMSEAQTADLLRVSRGTVKSQTSKALRALRIDPSISDDAIDQGEKA